MRNRLHEMYPDHHWQDIGISSSSSGNIELSLNGIQASEIIYDDPVLKFDYNKLIDSRNVDDEIEDLKDQIQQLKDEINELKMLFMEN